ncbi:DUF1152 domain-containing protein [Nonomuraea basaltis]|uniref:DUF1152 domain-containing protein n=1 Tax=Nonomuraea basaltis TaxID=2495887 RepID=UPI00110C443B|nr:DUF1152 domain-containing protein [Nonomuraea basaltis]TMR93699.1 DUF1152 domain-containing protein [Nonomuraea basaltis]
MLDSPLSARLEASSRILVAGAGGGFDVYAGLPLALALREQGKEVHLANLSFSRLDAIVLVDGGTDILMRGDESGLGTPVEDMASLAAVHGLDLPEKIVACLGFGIDAYHGVNHAQVLENLAALERDGAYLGAFSLSRATKPGSLYLDAVAHAQAEMPGYPSIVNGSIAAAVRGEFGDVRFTERTRGSELFINPLMAIYFAVDLDGLAQRSLYLDRIEDTVLARQIAAVIEVYREEVTPRLPRAFPH